MAHMQVVSLPVRGGNRAVQEVLPHPGPVPLVSPVLLYLGRLAETTRPCVRGRLDRCAVLLWPGSDLTTAPWETVTYRETAQLREALHARYGPRGFQTTNLHLQAVRALLGEYWKCGVISRDQYERARAVSKVAGEAVLRGRRTTSDTWAALLRVLRADPTPLGRRDEAVLSLLLATGMRRAEAVGLRLCDLDLRTGVVKVLGKGNRERESAVASWCYPALEAWLRVRGLGEPEAPMFTRVHHGGTVDRALRPLSVTGLYQAYRARLLQAGLPPDTGLHSMRRYVVTTLLAEHDIVTVAKQVGHKQVQTTMRYSDADLTEKQRAVDSLRDPLAGEQ